MPPAIIAAVIGAGASLGSTLIAKKGSGGGGAGSPTSAQSQLNPLIQQQAETARVGREGYGIDIGKFRDILALPTKFWTDILSGDPTKLFSTLSPEITAIHNAYSGADIGKATFSPIGGGLGSATDNQAYLKIQDLNKLIQSKRSEAAGQLGQLGGLFGSVAASELGSSGGSGASALNAALQAFLQNQAISNANSTQLGSGIGSLLTTLLPLLINRGGGGGGGLPSSAGTSTADLLKILPIIPAPPSVPR